ncbi:PPE domain-containing protein [Nocardia vaccinii]|uniref:PPE domain-containing protein n=1 Tax=Nocardia vaccinii TaxID=1822 RepID=UPI000834DCD5|nr:PPE domain-containing protein [Nocardia vaccinii]
MALNVDPGELAAAATQLAALAQSTHASLPQSWVIPAGAEQISAEHVPQLNGQAANLFDRTAGLLHDIHTTAHKIGAAAADYTRTDGEGGRTVGGSGGEVLSNPVDLPQPPGARQPPVFSLPDAPAVDPLIFAEQLRAGPGPGPAAAFASNVRDYLAGSHQVALGGLDQAARTMQHWTPVGTDAAAELDRHRGVLDELGTLLSDLADGADNYGNAFSTAKAQHPTPEEIIAARKELLAAIRSKNQLGVDDALAKFQEQNARSAETIAGYSAKVNSGNGTSSTSSGNSGGSGDSSALTSMLPLLTSMMSGANGLNPSNQDSTDSASDLGSLNDTLGGLGGYSGYGGGGGGGDSTDFGASVPTADDVSATQNAMIVGPMPLATSAAAAASGLASAPVAESLGSAGAAAAARAGGAGGSPMMPYMPMSPGMGGAGGSNNERNRVVAWHPDRLMYVDDTPHTEPVIGEKPTIAPSVTPPTPANPNSSPAGGSA